MNDTDPFYIGWQAQAPRPLRACLRGIVLILLSVAALLGAGLSLAQRTIGVSVFDWGRVQSFSGILQAQPYPHLLVPRPGAASGPEAFSRYYLVQTFKHGLDPAQVNRLAGRHVTLQGTLIYRDTQTMIEVVPGTLAAAEANQAGSPETTGVMAPAPAVPLGRQTLVGEIVDSKCYLGVMNPGSRIPHRACAIHCIRGGIPPVLLVRPPDGSSFCLLLVSASGQPVNREVLDMVAEPVEITGDVERQGTLLILRADPANYRRLGR